MNVLHRIILSICEFREYWRRSGPKIFMGVNGSTCSARAQVHEFCHSLRCHDTYVAVAFHLKFIGVILYMLETKVNVRAVYHVLMH